MTIKPILFSGPMVRALLNGTKTQTRRVITKGIERQDNGWWKCFNAHSASFNCSEDQIPEEMVNYLPIHIGDLLYVREAWRTDCILDDTAPRDLVPRDGIFYEASPETVGCSPGRLRPGMHMPRWASRLTLDVTDARVQRLDQLSEADAIAEGIQKRPCPFGYEATAWHDYGSGRNIFYGPRDSFRSLWDSINESRGFGWNNNPWVAAYSFKVSRRNVDDNAAAQQEMEKAK